MGAVGEVEGEVGEVVEGVEGADGGAVDGGAGEVDGVVEGFGGEELAAADFEAAGCAFVVGLEAGASAVAGLGFAAACAVFEIALGSGSVFAVGAEDVGRCVADVGLGEGGDKVARDVGLGADTLFEEIGCNAFVVAGYQGVVSQHRRAVDREPGQ